MGEISLNCILGSGFLAKTAEEVDFKAQKLCLHQRDKIGIGSVREEICDKVEEIRN